ncbi:MAG: succinate dehydrogenase, cytochrome b556 subunit [Rhodospirillaceae bacterium]|nr:succinate dehydrogenase, cytochrome b556 subunit [Rhodospirillaceae bacterium]|tara:strand:- start:176 stop:565 length:390 start_codon:yes stop_codon:yes gene_type:complete
MAQNVQRPLSPHLQVYRPQITSVLSILHRMTGVVLGLGALLLTYWIAAAATGPECFEAAQGFVGSWFGILLMLGFSYCLFYHLCNGIRHLFWDVGLGFELNTAAASGWLVVLASAGLTLLAWIAGFAMA